MDQFTIWSKMKRASDQPTALQQMGTDISPESLSAAPCCLSSWEPIREANRDEMLTEKPDVHLGQLSSHPSSSIREAWWLVTAARLPVDVSVTFFTPKHMWAYTNFLVTKYPSECPHSFFKMFLPFNKIKRNVYTLQHTPRCRAFVFCKTFQSFLDLGMSLLGRRPAWDT